MISRTLVTSASILAQLAALDAQSIGGQMRPQAVIIQEALDHPALIVLLLSLRIAVAEEDVDPELIGLAELRLRQSYFGLGIQIGVCLAQAHQLEESLCQS